MRKPAWPSSLPRARVAGCLFALVVMLAGCGYPVAEPANMELISSLRTALSARNDQWLDENEKIVEQRREAGEMGDEPYAAFRGIIDQARAGDWAGAEHASVDFQRAQRPTPEQIEQMRRIRGSKHP
jgi:hypothetical protein